VESIVISFLVVALAEFGDKTQLLAIVLASRFKQPAPVIGGILAATVANHLLAAAGGFYLSNLLEGFWFRLAVALSFVAMGIWTLIPDKADLEPPVGRGSAFLVTLAGVFLLEIGDKTQIATVALAARFHSILLVATGTTLGMMAADVPAVLLAEVVSTRVPLRLVRIGTALIFLLLGGWGLLELRS
jgi:putative Ca2+/H+ antiporter (TMEM165/GDT1 family)